ncbi:MAG: TIGR00296 family protein [Thermoplasmata archaeon]
MFTREEGEKAVKIARRVIESHVRGESIGELEIPSKFNKEMGVFVTINTHPSDDLRGCIGYPEPIFKLKEALVKAAKSATNDPRFPKLGKDELDNIIIEVTLLTPPEEIVYEDPLQLPKKIECGRDGLVISKGPWKGLLLPQVPVEYGWDEEEFLAHTCMKAGLHRGAWKEGSLDVEKFQGEIFAEESPRGNIVKKEIG